MNDEEVIVAFLNVKTFLCFMQGQYYFCDFQFHLYVYLRQVAFVAISCLPDFIFYNRETFLSVISNKVAMA